MTLVPTHFYGGSEGSWLVERMTSLRGEPLAAVERVLIQPAATPTPSADPRWLLRGVASYERYVDRPEQETLRARSPGLGRPEATCAALIPVRKSATWWDLPQDERRAIFEAKSAHIALGVRYLPAVARRLYQSRDLGEDFDFLTWFEYAPENAGAFEELVHLLRATEEWRFVDREVDMRLRLVAG